MDIIVERGAGLDVHKETVVTCIMGTGIKKEIRTFSTMTNDLLRLKVWLKEQRVTHVAMESTGVYWKPIFNILTLFQNSRSSSRHGTMATVFLSEYSTSVRCGNVAYCLSPSALCCLLTCIRAHLSPMVTPGDE